MSMSPTNPAKKTMPIGDGGIDPNGAPIASGSAAKRRRVSPQTTTARTAMTGTATCAALRGITKRKHPKPLLVPYDEGGDGSADVGISYQISTRYPSRSRAKAYGSP